MPSYYYKCPSCREVITVTRSIHVEDPGYECQTCKEKLYKVIGGDISLSFKGNGWAHKE